MSKSAFRLKSISWILTRFFFKFNCNEIYKIMVGNPIFRITGNSICSDYFFEGTFEDAMAESEKGKKNLL